MTQITPPEAGSYAGAVVAIVASMTSDAVGHLRRYFHSARHVLPELPFYMQRRDQREQR
jgi:hypothetical protein